MKYPNDFLKIILLSFLLFFQNVGLSLMQTNNHELINKKVMITGGANGIGNAIASEFAKQGAIIYIADNNQSRGIEAAKKLKAEFIHLDIRNANDWINLEKRELTFDILINNAGVLLPESNISDFKSIDFATIEQEYTKTMEVNLKGTFLGCAYAIKNVNQKMHVINIASSLSKSPDPRLGAIYQSSKAAILAITKIFALHAKQTGVVFNAVLPGPIDDTDITKIPFAQKDIRSFIEQSIPMGKIGSPVEVAKAVVKLSTLDYVNGAELAVDGGSTAAGMFAKFNSNFLLD